MKTNPSTDDVIWKVATFPKNLKFLFEPYRYKVLYSGRGAGKSWTVARALLVKGFQEKTLILCTREFQNSIEDSVHKLLAEQIQSFGLEDFYEIQKTTIIGKNGTQFIFKGLKHNIMSIKSFEGVDIVWCEEAQTISKSSWDILIPTIRKENEQSGKKSEIWVTFNPLLSTDDTYQRFVVNPPPTAIVKKLSWRDNKHFPSVLKDEMEYLRNKDPDAYLNVWEGHCRTTLDGAVYAKELREAQEGNRICPVPYDRAVPVNTFWDLGWSDSTAVWFAQLCGFEYHVIDYAEYQQTTINDIMLDLQARKYLFDTHWLPHDAQAKTMASGGRSIEQQMRASGHKVRIVPRMNLMDGINAARTLFPSCYFDEKKCADGLMRLRHYRYDVDEDTGSFSKTPIHDVNSHGADAFRYLALSLKEKKETVSKLLPIVEHKPSFWTKGGGNDFGTNWLGR